jgi:hypothetical protein
VILIGNPLLEPVKSFGSTCGRTLLPHGPGSLERVQDVLCVVFCKGRIPVRGHGTSSFSGSLDVDHQRRSWVTFDQIERPDAAQTLRIPPGGAHRLRAHCGGSHQRRKALYAPLPVSELSAIGIGAIGISLVKSERAEGSENRTWGLGSSRRAVLCFEDPHSVALSRSLCDVTIT